MGELDPSNAELGRRLDQIYGAVRDLIGRAEYAEYQRAVERQFSDLGRDIEDLRRQHEHDIRDVNLRITDETKASTTRSQWKTMLWVGLIPAAVSAIGIIVTAILMITLKAGG